MHCFSFLELMILAMAGPDGPARHDCSQHEDREALDEIQRGPALAGWPSH
jgi:hypothetical protein